MAATAFSGPVLSTGAGATLPNYSGGSNPDIGPSAFAVGSGLFDPRFPWRRDVAPGSVGGFCFYGGGDILVIDQVPSAVAVANIAAAANVTNGTPMTLVSASGSGITVTTAATTIPQTGNVVAAGALIIDVAPVVIAYGQNGTVAAADPRNAIARAVSITGSTSATGGAFKVVGADLYGNPQTETITAGAGAVTTNGHKGWKFILSVTPQFTDAHNYSVGTSDIYEFPIRVDEFAMADMMWNSAWQSSLTSPGNVTFTAADTTSPATSTTGSVRGTITTPSSSDGTKKLQIFVSVSPWNAPTVVGLFGVTPA